MSAFNQLANKLAERPGVTNPRALAAYIGRRKYGGATMARASANHESARAAQKQR